MSEQQDQTAKQIKEFWDKVLLNKTITKTLYNNYGLAGFLLNDGTKIGYDFRNKGLFVDTDKKGEIVKYH